MPAWLENTTAHHINKSCPSGYNSYVTTEVINIHGSGWLNCSYCDRLVVSSTYIALFVIDIDGKTITFQASYSSSGNSEGYDGIFYEGDIIAYRINGTSNAYLYPLFGYFDTTKIQPSWNNDVQIIPLNFNVFQDDILIEHNVYGSNGNGRSIILSEPIRFENSLKITVQQGSINSSSNSTTHVFYYLDK